MADINELLTQRIPRRRVAAGLTQLRFKRVQEFKILSGTDPTRYGRLGSSKWGDELYRFLGDKRISREDVQRWMDTNSRVTDPLPNVLESEPQLWSLTERAHDTENNQNYDALFPPIPIPIVEHTPAPTSDFNVLESGIPNVSDPAESSLSDSQAQNHSMPLKRKRQATAEEQEVSTEEVILQDIQIGFRALQTLGKLSKKFEKIQPSFLPHIHKTYRKLEEIQKKIVVPRISQPYLNEVKQELEITPEYIEIDGETESTPGNLDGNIMDQFGAINLVLRKSTPKGENIIDKQAGHKIGRESAHGDLCGNIMAKQATNLVRDSIPGSFGGNIMDNQSDDETEDSYLETASTVENISGNISYVESGDEVEALNLVLGESNPGNFGGNVDEMDVEANRTEYFDFSRYPELTVFPVSQPWN